MWELALELKTETDAWIMGQGQTFERVFFLLKEVLSKQTHPVPIEKEDLGLITTVLSNLETLDPASKPFLEPIKEKFKKLSDQNSAQNSDSTSLIDETLSSWKQLNESTYELGSNLTRPRCLFDLTHFRYISGSKRGISKPIVAGFYLLSQSSSVHATDFAFACFEITRFNADLHHAKLASLLTRMRKLLRQSSNSLRLIYRNEHVYADGNWQNIHFVREPKAALELRTHPEWRNFLISLKPNTHNTKASRKISKFTSPCRILKMFEPGVFLTRREIEIRGDISKSTAHRLIQRWITEKKLTVVGQGRKAQYLISQKLEPK